MGKKASSNRVGMFKVIFTAQPERNENTQNEVNFLFFKKIKVTWSHIKPAGALISSPAMYFASSYLRVENPTGEFRTVRKAHYFALSIFQLQFVRILK